VLCRDPKTGEAGFVLIRALEPVEGVATMEERRGTSLPRNLCSGPGKLSSALGIGPNAHERSLTKNPEFCLGFPASGDPDLEIETDRRVGISAAKEKLWRYLARDHAGISVKAGKVR